MQTTTPVFSIQRSSDRYFADHGWLKTYHSFSFADYFDPRNLNWGALRVFNDDTIAPAKGFGTHPHHDMEILTYVLEGELEHKDSMGNRGVVGPGSVQYMSAGTGVAHSEFNHSPTQPLRLVQMWVLPIREGMPPAYGQREFTVDDRRDRWLLVASGEPQLQAPVKLGQTASFSVAQLSNARLAHDFAKDRFGFFFVADGDITANGERLSRGDAVRMFSIDKFEVSGRGEIVLWDLPLAD